jgi:hypothetical protein
MGIAVDIDYRAALEALTSLGMGGFLLNAVPPT